MFIQRWWLKFNTTDDVDVELLDYLRHKRGDDYGPKLMSGSNRKAAFVIKELDDDDADSCSSVSSIFL